MFAGLMAGVAHADYYSTTKTTNGGYGDYDNYNKNYYNKDYGDYYKNYGYYGNKDFYRNYDRDFGIYR